jgi:KEOPS complex subunit Cgi121
MKREGSIKPNVAGARGRIAVSEILKEIDELKKTRNAEIIPLNPLAVCGQDHILSAYIHTKRAYERGTALSRTFSGEFLRYLTGERQISVAIERGGVKDGDSVVIVSEVPVDEVLQHLGLERDDSLIMCSEEKAEYLGLNGYLPYEEEVLEMVAMVAIL